MLEEFPCWKTLYYTDLVLSYYQLLVILYTVYCIIFLRIHWWTENSKEKLFLTIKKSFDQFRASLMNKSNEKKSVLFFFYLLYPKFLIVVF